MDHKVKMQLIHRIGALLFAITYTVFVLIRHAGSDSLFDLVFPLAGIFAVLITSFQLIYLLRLYRRGELNIKTPEEAAWEQNKKTCPHCKYALFRPYSECPRCGKDLMSGHPVKVFKE